MSYLARLYPFTQMLNIIRQVAEVTIKFANHIKPFVYIKCYVENRISFLNIIKSYSL